MNNSYPVTDTNVQTTIIAKIHNQRINRKLNTAVAVCADVVTLIAEIVANPAVVTQRNKFSILVVEEVCVKLPKMIPTFWKVREMVQVNILFAFLLL